MGEDWRSLEGTPAGKLLAQLYGSSKPLINYPTIRSKPSSASLQDRPRFVPGGSIATSSTAEVQVGHPQKPQVRVPNFGISHRKPKPTPRVSLLPRRKSQSMIEQEMMEVAQHTKCYRPPLRRPLATDEEKLRLQEICAHKGGKGLPQELLMPTGPTPTELAEERRRQHKLHAKTKPKEVEKKEEVGTLFDQIVAEIDERSSHLVEMESLGVADKGLQRRLVGEIAARFRELEKVDKDRARMLQQARMGD